MPCIAAWLANVCLKSWIRTSSSSAAFRTRRQGSLRSVRCAPLGSPNYDMWIAFDALGRGQNFQPRDRHRLGTPSQGLAEVELALHLMTCSHL